jgi:hypothetical protein
MAARVIHYGMDDCYRVAVLQGIGYTVEDCGTLVQLGAALSANPEVEAVLISETEGQTLETAAALAKSSSNAPLVLFRCLNGAYGDEKFDLIIETLTHPQKWVNDLKTLIERKQVLPTPSNLLLQKSAASRVILNLPFPCCPGESWLPE